MQHDNYVVELVNVYKNYGATEVLRGVNLTVKQGEFISIRGKSGVGKTNLFKIIGLPRNTKQRHSKSSRKRHFNTKR